MRTIVVKKGIFIVFLTIIMLSISSFAQKSKIEKANYDLMDRFTREKLKEMIYDTEVAPHWLKNSDRFWYSYKDRNGVRFYFVDPAAKTKRAVFNNVKMAAELTEAMNKPYDAQHIPIKTIKFIDNNRSIEFKVDTLRFKYTLATAKLETLGPVKEPKKEKDGFLIHRTA